MSAIREGAAAAGQNIIRDNPQGLGLIGYASNRLSKGESGFGAYKTPLMLLGAAGALTVGGGAYKGATNREDRDNAFIGGLKGMLSGVSNFSQDVLMPASLGVGALAATGFTRKFETGYMLTQRAAKGRDAYSQYLKAEKAGAPPEQLDSLLNSARTSIFPGGKAPRGASTATVDSRNAVDRTTELLRQRGDEAFTSRTTSSEIISELIEKDSKAKGGVLSQLAQGASSMGYAVGGFMGEVDVAAGQMYRAFKGGKYHGKSPDEINEMKALELKAKNQARNDPRAKHLGVDVASFAGKTAAAASVVGLGAYAGASAGNTGYFGGSPINSMSKALSLSPNDADFIYSQEQQKMGQYEMVAAYNPSQVGMRDTDDAYSYSRSINPSSVNPMSSGLASTAGRQRNISPGQFGDSGNLVFAMNTLRRG